jgi:hypothetical protein
LKKYVITNPNEFLPGKASEAEGNEVESVSINSEDINSFV